MLAFLRTFLAVLLAFAVVAAVPVFIALIIFVTSQDAGIEAGTWLTIDLDRPLLEYYAPTTVRTLFEERPTCLMEVLENLEKASVDKRIAGVILRLDGFAAGAGKIDEIRAAIRRVRLAGKPVYAYCWYPFDDELLLASECDSSFVFPHGAAFLLGAGVSIPHVKGVLEKLDIHDQLHRIDEYKSAAELFTRKQSSPQTLENLQWVVRDVMADFDASLGLNLGLDGAVIDALRARGVFHARAAVERGLVDAALHWDEFEDRLAGADGNLATVSSADYAEVDRADLGLAGKPHIAVIHAQGFVSSGGEDRFEPVVGLTLGTDRAIDDIAAARDDEKVAAIILRLDSGGGALDGSQRLARAVARARQEKPVIVSMADVAASGGYMMSYPADLLLCPGNGITGSIGSVTGKLNLRGFWEKLGFTYDDVLFAPNAFFFSELHDFTAEQWEILTEEHWVTYNEWVSDVAETRGLTFAEVDSVARGKVWTGRQALARRLVDEIGGFAEALTAARELADLKADARVTLLHLPRERSALDVLLSGDWGEFAVSSLVAETLRTLHGSRGLSGRALAYEPFRLRERAGPP
jgi:protease-4